MKYKLIAFDVTKVLEQSVGDRVVAIPEGADLKGALLEAGVPIPERVLEKTDVSVIKAYFGKGLVLVRPEDVAAVVRELSAVPGIYARLDSAGIAIRVFSPPDATVSLAFLGNLPKAKKDLILSVSLNNMPIGDIGLRNLEGLENLEDLYLQNTQITNIGLESLRNLKKLREINVMGTRVNKSGVDLLSFFLPRTNIFYKLT